MCVIVYTHTHTSHCQPHMRNCIHTHTDHCHLHVRNCVRTDRHTHTHQSLSPTCAHILCSHFNRCCKCRKCIIKLKIHIHTQTYAPTRTHIQTQTYAPTRTHTHTNLRTYTHTYTHKPTHLHAHTHTHIHTRMGYSLRCSNAYIDWHKWYYNIQTHTHICYSPCYMYRHAYIQWHKLYSIQTFATYLLHTTMTIKSQTEEHTQLTQRK